MGEVQLANNVRLASRGPNQQVATLKQYCVSSSRNRELGHTLEILGYETIKEFGSRCTSKTERYLVGRYAQSGRLEEVWVVFVSEARGKHVAVDSPLE